MQVKIIADSISTHGKRITTMQLKYQRFIHAEFMTHRVFSRNASSSRAIPVAKMIEQVRTNPATPVHWGKNQPGMQAKDVLTEPEEHLAKNLWFEAAVQAADTAERMSKLGLHKQVTNRILEPFQWIHVVVTSTEWDNFFELRYHKDAQPEIYELAKLMRYAMDTSAPRLLLQGEWHLPYVTEEEYINLDIEVAKKVSAARCCRVSYLKHDGTNSTIEEDLDLCKKLAGSRPIHASPFEHQAAPDVLEVQLRGSIARWKNESLHGNFVGWIQHRKLIEESFK